MAVTRVTDRDVFPVVDTERVLLVSNDAHVSAPVDHYREYCPKKYLAEFDEYSKACAVPAPNGAIASLRGDGAGTRVAEGADAYKQRLLEQPLVHYDPYAAIKEMDREGVAIEVVFHGAQNGYPLPFLQPLAFTSKPQGDDARAVELAAVGMRMYNRWLADYCSVEPGRHIGCAQVPIWDVDLAVRELEFAREVGLSSINFPAPRPSIRDYNELCWEPFWAAAEAFGMSLNTHCGGALVSDVASYTGVDGVKIMTYEFTAFSRRALPFMILGGVFERHPGLRLIFTEQPSDWVQSTLSDLDGVWEWNRYETTLPRPPSEYFWANCFVGLSFMSNSEARATLAQKADKNVLWGRDFPHIEGTWPNTELSLRMTLEDIPVDSARRMLGLNAVDAYGLDFAEAQAIADRVGPTVDQITTPLPPDAELPQDAEWTMAFRKRTSWS